MTSTGQPSSPVMGRFERYLTVWVVLCIVLGVVIGQALPALSQAVGRMEVGSVAIGRGSVS